MLRRWLIAVMCALFGAGTSTPVRAAVSVVVSPRQDTFARAWAPNATYGTAGLLSVSGPEAVNESGVANGIFDTWIQYDFASAKQTFDTQFGPGQWVLVAIKLDVQEYGHPNNPLFNVGVGQFEIRWIANDNWSTGPGSPSSPGTATGNQIGYAYGQSLLDPGQDESLGVFQNVGVNANLTFPLSVTPGLTQDLQSGQLATLHFIFVDPRVGFSFRARETGNPYLTLTADVLPPTPGDCDGNHYVDLADFSTFSTCFTGPSQAVAPSCECADLDADTDSDLSDFALFQMAFTGN